MTRASAARVVRRQDAPAEDALPPTIKLTDLEASNLQVVDLLRQNLDKTIAIAQFELQSAQGRWAQAVSKRTGIPVATIVAGYTFDVQTKEGTRVEKPAP